MVLGEGGTCGLGDHTQVGWVNAGVCSQSFIHSFSQSVSLSVCLCSGFCTWDRQAGEVPCAACGSTARLRDKGGGL